MNPEERVKEAYLVADTLYRYYAKLAARFYQFNLWLLFVISLLSIGAVIAGLSEAPVWAAVGLSSVAAVVAFMIPVLDFSRRAGVAASITAQCMDVVAGWDQLWWDVHSRRTYTEGWEKRHEELQLQLNRATSQAAIQNGFLDRGLLKAAGEDAQDYWDSAHAGA